MDITYSKGFITSIAIDKNRTDITENIEISTSSNNMKRELVPFIAIHKGEIKGYTAKDKSEIKIVNIIASFLKKIEFEGSGNCWKLPDSFVIIRLYNFKKHTDNLPYMDYYIFVFNKNPDFSDEIKISFTVEFTKIGMGKKNIRNLKAPLPYGKLKNPEELLFLIHYMNKIPILISNQKNSKASEVIWKTDSQLFNLEYIFPVNHLSSIENHLKNQKHTISPVFILKFNSFIFKPNFSGLEFFINSKDWVKLLILLSLRFSPSEDPFNIPISNKFEDFSLISFFKEKISSDTLKIKRDSPYHGKSFDLELNTTGLSIQQIIRYLHKEIQFKLKFSSIFFLNKLNPIACLFCAPLMRYLRGLPLLYDNSLDSISDSLLKNVYCVYFVDINPDPSIKKQLIEKGLKCIILKGRNFYKFAYSLNSEFLKVLAIDSLISSYQIMPTTPISPKFSINNDTFTDRKEIVDKLPTKFKNTLNLIINEKISKRNFNNLRFELFSLADNNEEYILKLFSLGNDLIESTSMVYSSESFKLKKEWKRDFFHYVFIDPQTELGNLIAATVYASYRGFFLFPLDRTQIEKDPVNFNRKISRIDGLITEKKYGEIKPTLKSYSKRISTILRPNLQNLILKTSLLSINEVKIQRETGQGLGYVTFFVPSDGSLYEEISLNQNFKISTHYAIGRIPIDDESLSIEIVKNSYRQIFQKEEQFSLLSLNYLAHSKDQGNTSFSVSITKEIFEILSEMGINTKILINEENLTKIIEKIKEYAFFIFWGHDTPESLKIESEFRRIGELSIHDLKEINLPLGKLGILNACSTGKTFKHENFTNFASILLSKGYLGVISSFWPIDTGTAALTLLNFLNKLMFGFSLPSILRFLKKNEIGKRIDFYIYYGDPSFTIESFYESQIQTFEKKFEDLEKRIIGFRNEYFKIESRKFKT